MEAKQRKSKTKKRRSGIGGGIDDDEDIYTMGGELLSQRKKATGKRRTKLTSTTPADAADGEDAEQRPPSGFGDGLPAELLARIFQLVWVSSGGRPSAPALSCVCRHWRAAVAAHEALLWESADLSYGWCRADDRVVGRLCRRGAWARLRRLNVQGCSAITDASLPLLVERCPALTDLDASGVPFTAAALVAAARGLKLRALALNGSAPAPIGEFDKTLSKLAEALGPSLESLSLRSCVRLGSAGIRALLACPGLRSLDLTAAGGYSGSGLVLPLEAMQLAWPLLEELRISGLGMGGGWKSFSPIARGREAGPPSVPSAGFPRLRVCHVALNVVTVGFARYTLLAQDGPNATVMGQLLQGSAGLTDLDTADNAGLTADTLRAMPFVALRSLVLSGSFATTDKAASLVAERWGPSLTELAMAGAGPNRDAGVTDVGLAALARCSALRSLDLSGSSVTTDGIRRFLASGPQGLESIKLELCRGLSRSVRIAAASSGGLAQLRAALDADRNDEGGGDPGQPRRKGQGSSSRGGVVPTSSSGGGGGGGRRGDDDDCSR